MMHCFHPDLEGYDPKSILHDGCEECEQRSRKGVAGLLDLDSSNLELLWLRCLKSRYSPQDAFCCASCAKEYFGAQDLSGPPHPDNQPPQED